MTLELEGDANDYVGKGLSGGRVIVRPPAGARFPPEENVIIGNTVLYGATGGELYASGLAGERFAVRNSGASAVVEGVGDHGCEYMTGGVVVVLGPTGRNFGAGMSGGMAFVLDRERRFRERCNPDMVELESLVDESDIWLVYGLVENHLRHTGSPVARRVLDHWDAHRPAVREGDAHRLQARAPGPTRGAAAVPRRRPVRGSGRWRADVMGKPTGFLEWQREAPPKRPKSERVHDTREFILPQSVEQSRRQAGRCMDCGIPFCHQGCPLGNLIPDFNDLVWRGRWEEAWATLSSTNDFPEFTGRLCPAPCEAACVLAIDPAPVTIEQIEKEIADRAFAEGWVRPASSGVTHREDGGDRRAAARRASPRRRA